VRTGCRTESQVRRGLLGAALDVASAHRCDRSHARQPHQAAGNTPCHGSRGLDARDVSGLNGIPLTTAARTLVDVNAAEQRASSITRSELEERFLALVRRGGLPAPEVNARLHGDEVDFLWRDQGRVLEVDGYAFHSTRQAVTRDRRKDNDLELAGFRVTRFTSDQILHDPEDTLNRAARVILGQ